MSSGADGGGDREGETRLRTILVVEDEPNTRQVLILLLEIRGYQVIQSVDGESGLQITRDGSPDLVVSDLQLPGISGVELAGRIQDGESPIPVIGITSGPEALIRRAMDSGHFVDVLSKPIDVDRFMGIIDGLLSPDRE